MSDGLHIRWRETAPDQGLLTFALSEIDALHSAWPETLQCNIVIERAAACGELARSDADEALQYHAQVELDLGRRSPRLRARALGESVYGAVRCAFDELRDSLPPHTPDAFTSDEAA